MQSPKLLVLSDLWGQQKWNWWQQYQTILSLYFDIEIHDICVLGQVSTSPYTQEHLHQQFVAGGIDVAINNLLAQENQGCIVLAFSMGGAIAWKAIQRGLKADRLYVVSATRLRYEDEPLSMPVTMWFGANDKYTPSQDWQHSMPHEISVFPDAEHELYREQSYIKQICQEVISYDSTNT